MLRSKFVPTYIYSPWSWLVTEWVVASAKIHASKRRSLSGSAGSTRENGVRCPYFSESVPLQIYKSIRSFGWKLVLDFEDV